MSTLGIDRALFHIKFYMRPCHEIDGAGKSPQAMAGEHWGGSAGKAGGRCQAACTILCSICAPVSTEQAGWGEQEINGQKVSDVVKGKGREGTDADRDQSVKHRLRGTNGIGQEERNLAGSISKEKAAKTLLESAGVRGESEIIVNRRASNYHISNI